MRRGFKCKKEVLEALKQGYDDMIRNRFHGNFLDALKSSITSVDMQKTFQQAISQIIVKNFRDDRQVCLYGVNKNIIDDFIRILKEVIPDDLIVDYFKKSGSF